MSLIEILFAIPHAFLFFFLAFPFITVLIARLCKEEVMAVPEREADIACIITAYQNIEIALPLVDSLLKQQYDNYYIYLVADDCEPITSDFDQDRVKVLFPDQKLGSKVRSINYAIDSFAREHSHVLIFDPDNLAPANFLGELNSYLQAGYPAVQGVRSAKNLDTLYACLDATGELYYNYTVRYVPWRLGASSTISGSGMVIETDLYRQYLATELMDTEANEVIVAEDKILQIDLIRRDNRIAYAKKAIIYDEKVTSGYQVERQRTRWINSYFQHLPAALNLVGRGIARFNFNQFLFGLFIAYTPLFLLVSASMLLMLLDFAAWFLLDGKVGLGFAGSMFIGMAIFVLNFLWVLYLGKAPAPIWKSLWGIPVFILKQFKALFKVKQSNKDFLVTSHSKAINIDQLEKKDPA